MAGAGRRLDQRDRQTGAAGGERDAAPHHAGTDDDDWNGHMTSMPERAA